MNTSFIPVESDFESWIREAVKESLNVFEVQNSKAAATSKELTDLKT